MEVKDFFTFEKFVTPKLITVIYWIGLFFIIISAIAMMVGGSLLSSFSGYGSYGGYGGSSFGIVSVIVGLLYGVVGALFWRVVCEIWVVIFSINTRLGTLVDVAKNEHK
ncbi:MAG: DUF4282 domain-containing protein [Rhizomicrobium sp.]|nr:DUF4282 domain-containing protein [Rhizomicrobium sp.]